MWACTMWGFNRLRRGTRRATASRFRPASSDHTGTPASRSSVSRAVGFSRETTFTSHPRRRRDRASWATCISAPPRARLVVSRTTRVIGHLPRARRAARTTGSSHVRRNSVPDRGARPANSARRPGSRASAASDSARAAVSPGGTRRPVTPCSTSSGIPPTAVATTGESGSHGLDHGHRASFPIGRQSEEIAGGQSRSGTSVRTPRKCTRSSTPSRAA